MRRLFIIFNCCFVFLSCRKEAKVKLPETKSLPVMYSYICPTDSLITLKLMRSSPLYTSNQINVLEAVSDGDVRISSDQGTAQLVFNQNTRYYELETKIYPIVAGQAYKITVTMSSGEVATAETEVPLESVPIQTVTMETIPEKFQTSDRLKIYFTDKPGTKNYYRISALHVMVSPSLSDTLTQDTRISEFYSDNGHDGESATLAGRYYQPYDSIMGYSSEYYRVFLYNCSVSYYSFHKSLLNYSGDNPFTEPTLIYTNVKGGFGCFGAYVASSKVFKKK